MERTFIFAYCDSFRVWRREVTAKAEKKKKAEKEEKSVVKNERPSNYEYVSRDGLYQKLSCRFQRCLLGEFSPPRLNLDPMTMLFNYRFSTMTKRKLQLETFSLLSPCRARCLGIRLKL